MPMKWKSILRGRTVLGAAAALTLALTVVTVGNTAAQAAAPTCPPGYACGWEDANFVTNGISSSRVQLKNYIPDLRQWSYTNTALSAQDSMSSIQNNGNYDRAHFYTNINGQGREAWLEPKGSACADLSGAQCTPAYIMNDAISSIYFG